MNLGLLGYGRMGREVERLAISERHRVGLKLDADENRDGAGLTRESTKGLDVVIDFTWPDAVLANIRRVAELGLPMVVGTTGWHDQLEQAQQIVTSNRTGLVYGANFSIGANMLLRLVEVAAELFDRFEEYDPYVFEHHHAGKIDAPSGTALRLAETIVSRLRGKTRLQVGNPEKRIAREALHVSSLRAGAQFGLHQVGFDGPADSIELTLRTRGREALARGALLAASWIQDKRGVFEFSECLAL